MGERKNAIVTGAASGLGRALAVELARKGFCVAIADVNTAGGEETLQLVRQAGGDGFVEELDVRHIEEWEALRDRLKAKWDHLDVLANNAGVAGSGLVGEYPIENWRWIIDINLWNGINGCHTFVDWLKSNPRGAHIFNTCSLAAIVSAPTMGAYNVTKAGMLALSETLYSELMPYNVGVTAICPAVFRTNLLDNCAVVPGRGTHAVFARVRDGKNDGSRRRPGGHPGDGAQAVVLPHAIRVAIQLVFETARADLAAGEGGPVV